MDRQLESPLLIRPLGHTKKLNSADTYSSLVNFMRDLPVSPARTQLERLTDALGVESGLIEASEGEAREKKRREEKAAARAERRRLRAAEAAAKAEEEKEHLAALVEEGLGEEDEGEMEEGAVGFEGEETMDDRGDVEYGDAAQDEDEDEPDNEKMEVEEE